MWIPCQLHPVPYATRALIDALLEMSRDRDPSPMSVALAVTPAEEFATDLPPETPVFTDFYLPETGGSVSAVFGMDLGTPRASGRFLTHPDGDPRPRQTDDFHQLLFVAVPPYDMESVSVYDRSSRRQELDLVEAAPPERRID